MKHTNEITALARVHIKLNDIVVWQVGSASGHNYNVVVFDGRVSGCERTDGEPCKGWKYRHSCHHQTLVQSREDERKQDAPAAPVPAVRGHLNGSSSGFSLLK